MDIIRSIQVRFSQFYYKITLYPKFGEFGKKSTIDNPLSIGNPENIFIGEKVTIKYKCWLASRPQTTEREPKLIIEDGCTIGNFCHIYATKSIHIKKNTLIAAKTYITDNLHSYENINLPVMRQPIKQLSPVVIGEGAWLGENVCVIGASIGKQSVIGSNSVVTKDIPDYCVAIGAPAKIVKRYNIETKQWEKTNPDGTFIETKK